MARVRPLDALLFALFAFDRFPLAPGVPAGVPLIGLLLVIAAFRRPTLQVSVLPKLAPFYAALFVYLAVVSDFNGTDYHQRLLRIVMLFLLTWVVAQGRFDVFSATLGLSVATVLINTPAYYLGLTSDNYPPFLTGWFGDKNVAGLWCAMALVIGLRFLHSAKTQLLWILLAGGALFLTGSRTSIAAGFAALLWVALRPRVSVGVRLILVFVTIQAFEFVEINLARIGVFADRVGTDWYRSLIERAMVAKIDSAPWYGLGLTEATVQISPERVEWFHNSYLALRVEGGVVLLAFISFVYVIVALGLLNRRINVPRNQVLHEAAVVVILVCAWKLGEVFFTSASALALGWALGATYGEPVRRVGSGDDLSAQLSSVLGDRGNARSDGAK